MELYMVYIVVLLVIFIFILLYIIANLYYKEKQYEDIIHEFQMQQEIDFEFINSVNDKMIELNSRLSSNKLITAFEGDDYIGFYFEDIRKAQSEVVLYLQQYNTLYINNGNIDGEEKEKKK